MAVISGKQLLGRRDNQEDAFDVVYQNERDPKSDILILVADGMGGHAGGEVASNLALAAFKKHFVEGSTAPRPRERLQEALHAANEALRQRIASQPDLKGMGCTLIAALKLGDRLVWVSVGDSSLYLMRDGRLRKLNADHSLYGELLQMVAAGTITQDEADKHPRRNALRSALMGDKISLIDANAVQLKPGDMIVACSDGLDTLPTSEIASLLKSGKGQDARGLASDLLNAVEARNKPKQDNTTVVVYVHVQEGMSSLLRGSQWSFGEGAGRNKTLKYASIALGALAVGATIGAITMSGGDDAEVSEEAQKPAEETAPRQVQQIGDRTVEQEPEQGAPIIEDDQVLEPKEPLDPQGPDEDATTTEPPDESVTPEPEAVTPESETSPGEITETPDEPVEEER